MERIIKTFSNEGDLIFDPFGGAGSTAIASVLLNRDFIITEIDHQYVEISKRNIINIINDQNGDKVYSRESVKQNKNSLISKKEVEENYIKFSLLSNKVLSKDEISLENLELFKMLEDYNGDFKKLQSIAARKLEIKTLFNYS